MTEKRKNYFQRLRDRLQSAITRQQEDTGPWESPDRYMIRGVPDEFRHIAQSSVESEDQEFLLHSLQKVVKSIRNSNIYQDTLDNLKKLSPSDKNVGAEMKLDHDIYKHITGEQYKKGQADNVKRNFFTLICRGVETYKKAPSDVRKKLDNAMLPDTKKTNAVARIARQQRG